MSFIHSAINTPFWQGPKSLLKSTFDPSLKKTSSSSHCFALNHLTWTSTSPSMDFGRQPYRGGSSCPDAGNSHCIVGILSWAKLSTVIASTARKVGDDSQVTAEFGGIVFNGNYAPCFLLPPGYWKLSPHQSTDVLTNIFSNYRVCCIWIIRAQAGIGFSI